MRSEFDMDESLNDDGLLARFALGRLNEALAHARKGDFYSEKLRNSPRQLDSLAHIRQLPVTRKPEVLADAQAHPPFGTRATVTREALRMVVTTSGTTGVGQEIYPQDAADEAAIFEMEARGFLWAGITQSSLVLNTLPMTTAAAGQWYYHGLRLLGATVMQVGPLDSQKRLDQLLWFRPDTIVGTPSYLYRLARLVADTGLEPSTLGVKRLILTGEGWAEDWLRGLGERWGAKLFEQYGCTQRAIAWNCELSAVLPEGGRGTLHTLPDHALYEVIDPTTGDPVGVGDFGELCITPFTANASPLIRFATGDRVQVGPPCKCRRPGLTLVSGRVNRFDQMLKVKGVNLWPDALDHAIFAVVGVSEYEATVVTDHDEREQLMIAIEATNQEAAEAVTRSVHHVTGLHAVVNRADPGSLSANVVGDFTKRVRLNDRRAGKERPDAIRHYTRS
jgi:phenylacetate-CoA ligase